MTVKPYEPEYYTDEAGEVRWRVYGENGEIVDASSEGFANLRKAWDNYTLGLQGRQVSFEEAKEQHGSEGRDAHTGDDGGSSASSGGLIADNAGSVGGEAEETDTNSGEAGARGAQDPDGGEDASDS